MLHVYLFFFIHLSTKGDILHWPPKYDDEAPFGSILDLYKRPIKFLNELFPDLTVPNLHDIVDIYSKRVYIQSKTSKRLTPSQLYGSDPLLDWHYTFAEEMIEHSAASVRIFCGSDLLLDWHYAFIMKRSAKRRKDA